MKKETCREKGLCEKCPLNATCKGQETSLKEVAVATATAYVLMQQGIDFTRFNAVGQKQDELKSIRDQILKSFKPEFVVYHPNNLASLRYDLATGYFTRVVTHDEADRFAERVGCSLYEKIDRNQPAFFCPMLTVADLHDIAFPANEIVFE